MKAIQIIFILNILIFADSSDIKNKIYTQIVNKLPENFCKTDIAKCSYVKYNECLVLIKYLSQACYYKFENKINDNISMNELSKIGNNIGQCTGGTFDMILKEARQIDTKCQERLK